MKYENFYEKNRWRIFKRFSKEELTRDIENYLSGSGRLYKVSAHYFKKLMYMSIGGKGKTSPYKALKNPENLKQAFDYINSKPKFYNGDDVFNLETYFRNCGTVALKVANFCPKNAISIYNRYNPENNKLNILDTSCGFGSRLSAAVLNGHNYYGFDPNEKLVVKLRQLIKFYKKYTDINCKCYIFCEGSETQIPTLFNKMDIAFTSPPYFDLERYSQDEGQSVIKFPTYDEWLKGFAEPTIINIYKCLKVGGYAMINIKNMTSRGRYPLFDDWFKIFKSINGFEFVEIFEIKHQHKRYFFKNTTYKEEDYKGFKEPVMVFRKVEKCI